MELIHQGKVRDVYADGGDLILVASDRVSVYDVVLPTPIPGKGALLTALSLWWFDELANIVPNHVISADDVPAEFAGRAVRVKRLEVVKVEAVVRGYLTGSGLAEYEKTGTVCGVALPGGLVDGSRLPEPIYTPTSKADVGDHDLPMTFDETAELVGADLAARIRDLALELYGTAARRALDKGIIIADTKFEFGIDAEGTLRLADEALTSDSSRFWDAAAWKPGQTQPSFDKQYVRDWARSTGWKPDDATTPEIPQDVIDATLARYIEAYERLTGRQWR